MSIPCRLRQDVWPKSPRVPGLSFPSYRDSTFLSIFAVPNNAVFWITSNLTFRPIRFMYSLNIIIIIIIIIIIQIVIMAVLHLWILGINKSRLLLIL